MNKIDKISLVRIVTDLIKADSVIDKNEMDSFEIIKNEYKITKEHLCEICSYTFSDAVSYLVHLKRDEKQKLLKIFEGITLADKMCNKNEALLMLALKCCFEEDYEAEMVHIQVPQQGVLLENSHVIYVESEYNEEINNLIVQNYHQIENALRLAGFDFTYIPQVAKTYCDTPKLLFDKVMTFLTPNLNEPELKAVKAKISSMTTVEFCKEQLCRKLNLRCLADTYPALFMKVGDTVLDNSIYANFLKIEIKKNKDIVEEVKQLIFLFTSMMNAEYSILKNVYNSSDRFIYSGVYKQIIDLCLMKEIVMSTIMFDAMQQQIFFHEIGEKLSITRSEKALYSLIIAESSTGGLNFNQPTCKQELLQHNRKMEKLMKKYKKIYNYFGGDETKTPDILDPSIRNPKISRINSSIMKLKSKLPSYEEYMIKRTDYGLYKVNIDKQMVYVMEHSAKPFISSDFWRNIVSM